MILVIIYFAGHLFLFCTRTVLKVDHSIIIPKRATVTMSVARLHIFAG